MKSYRAKIDELRRRYDLASATVKREKQRYMLADDAEADCREAQEIIQAVAQTIQQQAHIRISHVVSRCLTAVFDEPYEFSIEFDRKRGRTEATLVLSRDGLVLRDPMESTGGGVIDVAAFALRLAALLLAKPERRRVMILDEPFKHVHPPERRPRIVEMLRLLADEFDMQFIIVTGIEELHCGHIVTID